MASPVNRNCVTCIGTLLFPMCLESVNTGFLYLVYWQWINYPKGGRAGSTVLWLMCEHSACIRGTVAFIAAYRDTLIGMFFFSKWWENWNWGLKNSLISGNCIYILLVLVLVLFAHFVLHCNVWHMLCLMFSHRNLILATLMCYSVYNLAHSAPHNGGVWRSSDAANFVNVAGGSCLMTLCYVIF